MGGEDNDIEKEHHFNRSDGYGSEYGTADAFFTPS